MSRQIILTDQLPRNVHKDTELKRVFSFLRLRIALLTKNHLYGVFQLIMDAACKDAASSKQTFQQRLRPV